MKTTIIVLNLVFILVASNAQEMKVKFGKISPADLAMKEYAPDTEAVAVILSKVGRVKYDVLQDNYSLTEHKHVVLKILKESGIDQYGNAEINYYSHNNYSKVGEIKAIVHLPDGTEVKVDNSQIFNVKINDYWSAKRITFPKLVPGAIIEYQYVLLSNGMYRPVDWFFQDRIPIAYSELTTKIPEWFEYVILAQGQPIDKKESNITMEAVNLSYVSRGSHAFEGSSINNRTVDVKFINQLYINKDVPGLKEECCITTMKDYYSRIRYQLKAFQLPYSTRQPILNSWTKLAEELYDNTEWGGQFKNKRPGELVLAAAGVTIPSQATPIETARKIYDFINSNIHWNEYYDFGWSNDIASIMKEKTGSSGNLNKLMYAALLQAGIEAKPVLLSTRNHGKPLELYPFTDQFNHMIVLAKIDNKDVWIDAGDKNIPMGMLRANSLNLRGWVVDAQAPVWIDIKPADSKSVFLIKGIINEEGQLNGVLETRFTGYHALNYRQSLNDKDSKFGEDLLVSGTNRVKVHEIELINVDDPSLPLQMRSKIIDHQISTATPDKLYITHLFPKGFDELPFKLEERTYPIEMNYPSETSIIINVEIPPGYTVESMPANIKYVTENGGLQVTYEATQTPGRLNVTMKYAVKQLHFNPEEYATLKNLYDQRHQKFNEVIVLSKA